MHRLIASLLGVVACAHVVACAVLQASQRSLLYFPQPAYATDLAVTEKLPVADATVLATVHEHVGPGAVILFPGNGDAAGLLVPSLVEAFPDRAIFVLNYRGYGGSTGQPTESTLQSDALVLFDVVAPRHPNVIVIGRSLGSGIAIRVAARRPVASLVLVTPYNSIEELAQDRFPIVPVHWLLVDKYESWRYAPDVHVPTLLIAAEHDRVVPRWSTEALLAQFHRGVARMIVVPDADHGSILQRPEYAVALRQAQEHDDSPHSGL